METEEKKEKKLRQGLKHKTLVALLIGVILMVAGSIFAKTFNTSDYSVKVTRIYFETESGTLSGLLYMPKDASASDPKPTLITTHGYLNSAEMQDAPAIEMSRRGFVVLALDMYDHGHSIANEDNTGNFFTFWPTAMWDAVQYMYQQDYVLKDSEGNGIIAVSGHSMGGFSSSMALYYDELAYEQTGIRMIYAGLTAGSDYQWSSFLGLDADTAFANSGGRWLGKIAAHYDEFFFNDGTQSGTVVYKDYVSTDEGKAFLEQEEPADNTWYETSDGGMRIIYEPNQIHPWNHFSRKTTAYMIDFYQTAFEDYSGDLHFISSSNQIWMFKEFFELVALAGFIMFIIFLVVMLIKVPFLKKAKTAEVKPLPAVKGLNAKIGKAALFIPAMLYPAIIFPALYDGDLTAEPVNWMRYAAIIAGVIGIVALIISLASKKEEGRKNWIIGSCVVIAASAWMTFLTTRNLFSNVRIFQAGTTSSIATWAMICACIGAVIMMSAYLLGNKRQQGVTLVNYGLSAKAVNIIAGLVVAVIVVVAAYLCLFAVDAIFKTDFRFWTFAFKTFEMSAIPAALKYMPFFLIYYLEAGVAAVCNTNTEKLQGFWGYVLASLINMGGILIWLVVQYGKLFITGSAFYTNEALGGILLFALVPTLVIASCFSKFIYKKTGNVYTAVFLNTILMTMMTVANTTVFFQ